MSDQLWYAMRWFKQASKNYQSFRSWSHRTYSKTMTNKIIMRTKQYLNKVTKNTGCYFTLQYGLLSTWLFFVCGGRRRGQTESEESEESEPEPEEKPDPRNDPKLAEVFRYCTRGTWSSIIMVILLVKQGLYFTFPPFPKVGNEKKGLGVKKIKMRVHKLNGHNSVNFIFSRLSRGRKNMIFQKVCMQFLM